MKKLLMSAVLALAVTAPASATPLLAPALFETVINGFAIVGPYVAAKNEKMEACQKEPLRTVAWANNPNGYSFEVAGCDYQANKSKYVAK
jgi:hypothetical protein